MHQLALLLPFCAVLTVGARLARRPWFALPVLPLALHSLAQRGVVRLPESTLEWGVTSTTAGFAVLALALYGSWRMGARKQAFIGSAAQGAK